MKHTSKKKKRRVLNVFTLEAEAKVSVKLNVRSDSRENAIITANGMAIELIPLYGASSAIDEPALVGLSEDSAHFNGYEFGDILEFR